MRGVREGCRRAMQHQVIKQVQMDFFRNNGTGCAFAAYAARNPEKYGWHQEVVPADAGSVDRAAEAAVASDKVSMVSLIFPEVVSEGGLLAFIAELRRCSQLKLELDLPYEDSRCLGFRAHIGPYLSWVTGFGPFEFFPPTRRAPSVELTFRVKPRPNYKWVMKEAPAGVLHLADLDMLGMAEAVLRSMWNSSLARTRGILGHEPDLRSAAKTTFSVPLTSETGGCGSP